MRVMICYSNIPNKVNNKNNDLQPFWEHPNYMENWEEIYDNPEIISTLTQGTLILNGFDLVKYNILNIQDLKFNMVLLMYLPNMWGDDYDYQCTLVDVNHYYETNPYEAKKNQQDPKRGRYKSISHGYSTHGGRKSQGNVVMYHHDDILESKQMSYRGLDDNIASSVWKQMDKFGSEVKFFFEDQFYPMNCIPIGLEGYTTQVYQLHISKNSYIKPHIDMSDLNALFISWFRKGQPGGECFGMF